MRVKLIKMIKLIKIKIIIRWIKKILREIVVIIMIDNIRILNKINGNCYYGSSNNVEKRWLRHKNELNKGK